LCPAKRSQMPQQIKAPPSPPHQGEIAGMQANNDMSLFANDILDPRAMAVPSVPDQQISWLHAEVFKGLSDLRGSDFHFIAPQGAQPDRIVNAPIRACAAWFANMGAIHNSWVDSLGEYCGGKAGHPLLHQLGG